jgi:plastocyanin
MKVSVGEGMMSRSILRQLALLLCFTAPVAGAQGSVAGQVSLLERPGESSEDLADVIVWLDPVNPARSKMAPITTTVQLKSRQFNPRVQAVTEGSRIDFPNQDSFSHNVFSKAPEGAFDTGVYGRGKTMSQTFKDSGVFPIYCNIHPRMTGYVVVLKTPYYVQAGDDGRFSLAGVPAGNYTMHVWHDRASAETTKQITVAASGLVVGRMELDARGYRYVQHKNKFGQEYSNAGDRY